MLALPEKTTNSEAPLQLLLFVDKRPISGQHIQQIRQYLKESNTHHPFDLQIIDVGEQPHLAEHFKLVATPALIKIHPEPKQTLAGSNIIAQLDKCWPRWQNSVSDYLKQLNCDTNSAQTLQPDHCITSMTYSAEMMQLSDEIFRLKQEKEELLEQLRFKDRLMAILAHDLRNPLTAASIAIETLELNYSPLDGQITKLSPKLTAQLIQHARTQTRNIDRMITDLLQVAHGVNAQLAIHPKAVDIGELCQEIIQNFKEQLETKSLQLKTDIPLDLPRVNADPDRIRQVMMNLLDNAIKYTLNGGNIHVSILHRTTQKIQVSVCDSGLGIPEENKQHIFEDRYRLKRDEKKDGYGIGLSLCQRIVRAHYGQIWVDSTPHQGSCFHFTLPVYWD